jgi:beta-N-acetylhexosaminidase
LRVLVGREAPIFIDQEGGGVQRLRPPLAANFLAPLDEIVRVTKRYGTAVALRSIYLRHRLIAADLHALGIDANCAPTADIACNFTHEFLRKRCYGTHVVDVSAACRAAAEGLLAGGVLPVIKHIPGHGRATQDTHFNMPRVTASKAELIETDFAVFKALADLPYAMTAHLVYAEIDEEVATCSKPIIDLVRHDIGFDGALMSDDLSMKSLSGSLGRRATRSLAAGCDLVLHCNGDMAEMVEICNVAGDLTGKALNRANQALLWRKAPQDIDILGLRAEHFALSGD